VSKQSLLLVDGDTRSLRVLEVSLRKAGFVVTAASSVQDALDKLELHAPDLIISETTFPEGDGFELRRRVRATPDWSEIPFIFLTAEAAIENKIRGLELGVDDYLTKPIYIKEIVTRINILLQKRQRVRFEERRDGRTRFAGRVHDMPVVDVIQTIEISRKSGVIQFVGERGRQAAIYFRDGRVIDAEAGALQGEDAVYRLLTWSEGEFEVVFRTVRRREVITVSSQGLLMEGMRRLDEWSRLFEQLPPLAHRFEVDTIELAGRLGDVPDDNNRILRLFDGKRTLLEVIDASDVGDLECLQAISRLYFEELLLDLDHGKAPRRDTGRPIPLVDAETPTPVEDVTSGPLSLEAPSPAVTPAPTMTGTPEPASPAPVGGALASPASSDAAAHGEATASAGATEQAPGAAAGAGDADGADQEASFEEVGPLMGGYRPSSLRLIDEAVAAAQAIEPSLFDEMVAEQVRQAAAGHAGNGAARGAATAGGRIPDAADTAQPSGAAMERTAPSGPSPSPTANEREESGLRMIGSLGRDRAEASGELAPLGQARAQRSETARELVTILPRRVTREMPVMTQELAESLSRATPTAAATVSATASATASETATPTATPATATPATATSPMLAPRPVTAPALEVPKGASHPPRVPLPGSGVRAPSRSLGPLLLIILAVVLAGTAVLLRLRRHTTPSVESVQDAATPPVESSTLGTSSPATDTMVRPDAAAAVRASAPLIDAGSHEVDAGRQEVDAGPRGADAGRQEVDAGPRGADVGSASAGLDKVAEAKNLYDKAHDALDEGNFARAFELAESSLKLRKTARTYLLRAQAEQRLERVDAALASVDAAAAIAPEYGAVWEMRGRILWAVRRRDEARAAFEKFLQLEPDSPKAAYVRRLMNEPR
jgi:CheY-like chemotaxis protein